jgi:hypothetical protein
MYFKYDDAEWELVFVFVATDEFDAWVSEFCAFEFYNYDFIF